MLPGSNELADATIKAIDEDYDVVMWEKHGVFAVGDDVMEAFDMIDTLTKSAIIYRDARSMGFIPDGMSEAQMKELSSVFNLPK
jgi:rhamnulose-1-phosphate aldolase